ncbi:hypothetical protein Ciccas_001709 [Cichlidogyrus casuarinus]|uniref:Uncharacterized protein n=1 Tax=Cichlidogyrus casuarinus TaxID=1844966 RepID=A0ABD2QJ79_9PLAT
MLACGGCRANTGWDYETLRLVKLTLARPLQRSICCLHLLQLPFKAFLKVLGNETTGLSFAYANDRPQRQSSQDLRCPKQVFAGLPILDVHAEGHAAAVKRLLWDNCYYAHPESILLSSLLDSLLANRILNGI